MTEENQQPQSAPAPPAAAGGGMADVLGAMGGALEGTINSLLAPVKKKLEGLAGSVEKVTSEQDILKAATKGLIDKATEALTQDMAKTLEDVNGLIAKVREDLNQVSEDAKSALAEDMAGNIAEMNESIGTIKEGLKEVQGESTEAAKTLEKMVDEAKIGLTSDISAAKESLTQSMEEGLSKVVTNDALLERLTDFKKKLEKAYVETADMLKKEFEKTKESSKLLVEESKQRAEWAVDTVAKSFGDVKAQIAQAGADAAAAASGKDLPPPPPAGLSEAAVKKLIAQAIKASGGGKSDAAPAPAPSGGGGGLTEDEVRAMIAEGLKTAGAGGGGGGDGVTLEQVLDMIKKNAPAVTASSGADPSGGAGGGEGGGEGGGVTEDQVKSIVEREVRNAMVYLKEEVIPKAIKSANPE